jgi:hypothetical protein
MDKDVLDECGGFTIHRMAISDIEPLVANLSKSDKRELELLQIDPIDAIRNCYMHDGYVARYNGVAAYTFGINTECDPNAVWLLGTDDKYMEPVAFHRLTKRWVAKLGKGKLVANIVPADHQDTIKWLKSLDFTFNSEPYMIYGHEFLKFMRDDGPATRPRQLLC